MITILIFMRLYRGMLQRVRVRDVTKFFEAFQLTVITVQGNVIHVYEAEMLQGCVKECYKLA